MGNCKSNASYFYSFTPSSSVSSVSDSAAAAAASAAAAAAAAGLASGTVKTAFVAFSLPWSVAHS